MTKYTDEELREAWKHVWVEIYLFYGKAIGYGVACSPKTQVPMNAEHNIWFQEMNERYGENNEQD